MAESELEAALADVRSTIRVVIIYRDVLAGKRAMRVITDLAERLGDTIEFVALPWSFELLADSDWRAVAADDAVAADILILATGNNNPIPPPVEHWVEDVVDRKKGSCGAVIALLGPDNHPDRAGLFRLKAIQTATRRAGLDFFVPRVACETDAVMARVQERAETVSSLLEEILHQRHPLPAKT